MENKVTKFGIEKLLAVCNAAARTVLAGPDGSKACSCGRKGAWAY